MRENNIDMTIKGIKCDEPDCDFVNMDIKVENYEDWVNVPCPKCSANLLTYADYKTVVRMTKMVNFINRFPMPRVFGKKDRVRAEMNGSGKVKFKKL